MRHGQLLKFGQINLTYKSKFIIMGLGNGMYLKALKERYPDNIIICIEVFEELENEVLHNVDVSDLVGDKVFLAVGENRVQLFREYLSTLITYIDKDELFYKAIPNYNKINNKARAPKAYLTDQGLFDWFDNWAVRLDADPDQ